MKKVVIFTFSMIICFTFLFANLGFISVNAVSQEELITESHATYKDGEKYSGKQIASHIDVGAFADFNIVEDGGTHIDGVGNQVYSNYVIFGVDLNFDPNTKYIGDTGVKVSKDGCDWNETPYSSKGDTEQYIAYGAISATKTDAEGNVFKYEPMFSKGNTSVENMIFNEDGDYTVFVLFETVKNGKYQNHVLSWSFKIRSYIYLVDAKTGFPIKESGISSKNVVLDYAGRQNIEVECTLNGSSIDVSDGFVLSSEGQVQDQYKFTVKSNGFVCEAFNFRIDSKNPTSQFFFANLRKQLGAYYYEAEEYFFLTWAENSANPITVHYDYYDYSSDEPITAEYVDSTVMDKVGLYRIYAETKTHLLEYWIEVVEGDAPSYNREALSAERFNNFKTKWYEVYDDINNRYLCFDVEEYNRAYEAAMTIENSSVSSSSGKYYYNGNWYSDRIDLTAAMNEYVFTHNLKLVYFDPTKYFADEESERTFSTAAFDGTIYLNDDFQFVNSHYSETHTVVATDKDGNTFDLRFFEPISKQNLVDGEYVITETDFYGNSVSYSAFRDKSAPTVMISLGGSTKIANNGGKYSSIESFSISEFKDVFDDFAVLKITKPDSTLTYYYQSEYAGIVFEQKGEYSISAYDRNGNVISFTVEVN